MTATPNQAALPPPVCTHCQQRHVTISDNDNHHERVDLVIPLVQQPAHAEAAEEEQQRPR